MDQSLNHPQPPPSASQEDLDIWEQVLSKRKSEWSRMDPHDVGALVDPIASKGSVETPQRIKDPYERLEYLLQEYMYRSLDDTLIASARRKSWNVVKSLLSRVDQAVRDKDGDDAQCQDKNTVNCPLNTSTPAINTELGTASVPILENLPPRTNNTENGNSHTTTTNKTSSTSNKQNDTSLRNGKTQKKRASQDASTSSSSNDSSSPALKRRRIDAENQTCAIATRPQALAPIPVTQRDHQGPEERQPSSLLENPSVTVAVTGSSVAGSDPSRSVPQVVSKSATTTTPPIGNSETRVAETARSQPQQSRPGAPSSSTSADTQPSQHPHSAGSRVPNGAQVPVGPPPDIHPTPQQQQLRGSSGNTAGIASQDQLPPTTGSDMGVLLSAMASGPPDVQASPIHSSTRGTVPRTDSPTPVEPPVKLPPVTMLMHADYEKLACTLAGRSMVKVTVVPQPLSTQQERQFRTRLLTWDPYWTAQHRLAMSRTSKIQKCESLHYGERPQTAVECSIVLKPEQSKLIDWGNKHGQYRILLRMLPLVPPKKPYRADAHLWPRGTFLQVNGSPMSLVQRKQQSHNVSLWKGMCHALDLTPLIGSPTKTTKIQLCCYDEEPYAVCIALCKHISIDTLYDSVNTLWMRKLSYQESVDLAMEHVNRQTIVLEDDHDANEQVQSSLTFSLTCPISKTLIKTPVRGVRCKHWQCFDLRNYLETNKTVSGGRWRCAVCEDFVSCRELQQCGLYEKILKECAGEAHSHRDRISFKRDATWTLMEENERRYAKRRSSLALENGDVKRIRVDTENQQGTGENAVIDLL